MSLERIADHEQTAHPRNESRGTNLGERFGAALASPLGVVLVIPTLVAVVGLILSFLGQNALRESTTQLGGDRFAEQTSSVARGIATSLAQADPMLDRLRDRAAEWQSDDPAGPIAHILRGLMQGRPGVAYVSLSYPNGRFRGAYLDEGIIRFADARRMGEGTLMQRFDFTSVDQLKLRAEERTDYDPRRRDFYKLAVQSGKRVWTKPYTFYSSQQTGVTRTEPIFTSGPRRELHAVLTVDFDVLALSHSMAYSPTPGAKTLLYSRDGTLLAYPEGAVAIAHMPRRDRVLKLLDLRDPTIDNFIASTRDNPVQPGRFMRFASAGEPSLAMIQPVPGFPELGWMVAGIVPETMFFRARIQHEKQSLVAAALALVLALSIAVVFARHIVRVRQEVQSARALAREATERAKELGSYRLVERLGAGGMGEVWRAEHRLLVRQAAIKIIRGEALANARRPSAQLRERFRREAQTLATLKSRHTIQLYDFGVTENGTFFLVMELLDGMDLDTLVTRYGPQPAGRVIEILLQACSSLAEAHDAGLVHRDVKPANIFVCRAADEFDIVKMLDFGLVQGLERGSLPPDAPSELDISALDASHITQAGQLMGTPAFMSPEQALGQETDARSDIYALGCVAVWLLSGKLLFESETAFATLVAHVTAKLPDLSTLVPGYLPPELERILRQCLEKSRDDRPRDVRTLAESLRNIELPPEERWTSERKRSFWATHTDDQSHPADSVEAPALAVG